MGNQCVIIYIPIWLDLLYKYIHRKILKNENLHSNMVRFIIDYKLITLGVINNLHSNMVRFIIQIDYFRQAYGYIIYIPIWLDLLL